MTAAPGVAFLDHTADVGIRVDAPSLAALFHRAALGTVTLLRGMDDVEEAGRRDGTRASVSSASSAPSVSAVDISLEADSPAALMADWLRELLFLHETEHRDYVEADFGRLEPLALEARVLTEPATGAVREIKGVTYHGLVAERSGAGWRAVVIFDV